MTPAQRAAKIAAAEALLNDVAADEATPAAPTPVAKPLGPATNVAAAQAQVAASVKALPVTGSASPAFFQEVKAVAPVVAAVITGPGGDTRVSGQPSLAQTMSKVWNIMKGNK